MGVTSEQDCRNMNRFVVACAYLATTGYAGQIVSAPVASAPAVVGQTHHSYAAGPPQNLVETRALPPPAIPAAPAPYAAIPPAPRNLGPAPADTVTQTRIAAPVRSHTRVTPQVTNIVPEVAVHQYNVDIPVPRAVHVPAPYKVHPVQEIVETPHIHHATVETHSTQAVVTAHATPVHAVSHAPVAAVAAAPAVASVGYAAAAPVAAATYAAAPALAGAYAAAPAVAAPAATAVIA